MGARIGGAAGLISVAALLAGCGGGGSNAAASCGKVAPCGGTLIGTWTIVSSCESLTNFTISRACPAGTIDESQLVTSGTLVFKADMTFTSSTSLSGTRRFSVPLDCAAPISSCDDLAIGASPGPPDATTTCTTMGDTCACSMVYAGAMTATNSGIYGVDSNALILDNGASSQTDYCVQGSTLHLIRTDSTTGDVTSDVVATK